MPLYEYECPKGHRFEVLRPIDRRNDPIHCEKCRSLARLVVSAFTYAIDWNSVLKKLKPEAAPNDSKFYPKWDDFRP